MLRRPTIKPDLRVKVVEGEGVFVLSESRQLVLQGRLYELVMPKLDGRPVEEVCKQLAGQASSAKVFYTLRTLERRGFLCENDENDRRHGPYRALPAGEAALWAMQEIEPATAAARLARTKVSVDGLGLDAAPLCSLLEELGVQVVPEGCTAAGERQLVVVVTDCYLRKGLQSYNEEALRSGRPWLLVKPVGGVIWIGPIFRPGRTGCWECLARRIRSNFPVIGYLDSLLDGQELPTTDCIQTPATLSAAWGLVGNTVANWIAQDGGMPHLEGCVQTLNLVSLQSQSHKLLRQPACPACGDVQDSAEIEVAPLVLKSCKKTYTEDGGHRATSPQETLEKYGHHVSPICGAVTMLERSAPTDNGVMHVFVSGCNIARGPQNLFNLRVDLRSQSAGKGIEELQAKASALCEGLERYSGIFRGDEPLRKERFRDLEDAAIHPNTCMLFSDKQYEERHERNAKSSLYGYIPMPFDPEAEVEWSPVWSLTQDRVRYLPAQFCYFNYPHECGKDFCVDCSNGNAAGNSLEEAIAQGFFELVERDGVSLWWYNRVRMPGVDLDSFNEPYLDRLRSYLQTCHRDLWALDLTSDLGIPVFAALSHRTDGHREQIMFGFGAHFDPRIALLRAVTEMNQMLVPILDSPPDGPPSNITDEETIRWLQTATLEEQSYLVPQETPMRTASSYPRCWTDDLKEDILMCRSRVEQLGLEMLVLNQTRPEIGMPVVKVIVPGLRHFWTRFAPGRLYDVPVKLAWLDKPVAEERLNPTPMFL